MPRAPARRLLRRELVESASGSFLARFLAPWSSYLPTRALELADDAKDPTRAHPRRMLAPWLGETEPELAIVRAASAYFAAELGSTALRLLHFARIPAAAVCTVGGRIQWWAHSPGFTPRIRSGSARGSRTAVDGLHSGGSAERARGARGIDGSAWGETLRPRELREEAVRLGRGDAVLTWMAETRR